MKKIILITLLFCSQLMAAQQVYNEEVVDVKPSFPGGEKNYKDFVQKNFKWINEKNPKSISLEFIVQITGALTDIKVINPVGSPNEKEALRVMALSPKWAPGAVKGKAVPIKVVRKIFHPYFDHYQNDGMISVGDESANLGPVQGDEVDDNTIYNTAGIEVKPEYPGGMQKFFDFFLSNYKIPDNEEDLKGKIFFSFIVEKDGSLSDIKVLRDIGYGSGKEGIRVMKMSPRWNPGMQNGKKVRVLYMMPVVIQSNNNATPVKKQ